MVTGRQPGSHCHVRGLNSVTPTRTTAEWLVWCKEAGIPATPVKSLDELVDELPLAVHPKAGRYRVTPMPARIEGVAAERPALHRRSASTIAPCAPSSATPTPT